MATMQLDGGRVWKQTRREPHERWESECGGFDVLYTPGRAVLVAFNHEPNGQNEFWQKLFGSLAEAMAYAERM